MIEMLDVTKQYGRRKSLEAFSAKFEKGKMIGLIGENGSGKTTLLKLLAGLLTANKGDLKYDGIPITRKIAGKVAYMSDSDQIFPYFTISDLFKYYATQFPDFNQQKAEEIALFLNIELGSRLKNLSKGNRGRAKIAATLGREVDYYLLDEPLSGLDPMVRNNITKGLIRFIDPDCQTVIISTHEIKEVEPLLDEIIVLKQGQLLAHETVDSIRDTHSMDTTTWMIKLFENPSEILKGSE